MYHPHAVANASAGRPEDFHKLDSPLLLIRLGIELESDSLAEAEQAMQVLQTRNLEGYLLYLLLTVTIIVAFLRGDKTAFAAAVRHWLIGRNRYPENFMDKILDEPCLQQWLEDVDLDRLASSLSETPRATPGLIFNPTANDLAFIKDVDTVKILAVRDNLKFLRELQILGTKSAIASRYTIRSVICDFNEITISGESLLPAITIALSQTGEYVGSFLSH